MKNYKAFYTIITIIFLLNTLLVAQIDSIIRDKITLGVAIGNIQGKNSIKKANWVANGLADTLSGLSPQRQGFSLALQARYCINSRLSLRLHPGFSFDDLIFTFFRKDGKTSVFSKDNIYFDIPIDMVFSLTDRKIKPSVILGMRYSRATQSTSRGGRGIYFFPDNFGFNIGTGIDVTLKRISIRPEVLYYFSPFNSMQSETLFAPFKAFNSINRNYIDFRFIVFMKMEEFDIW